MSRRVWGSSVAGAGRLNGVRGLVSVLTCGSGWRVDGGSGILLICCYCDGGQALHDRQLTGNASGRRQLLFCRVSVVVTSTVINLGLVPWPNVSHSRCETSVLFRYDRRRHDASSRSNASFRRWCRKPVVFCREALVVPGGGTPVAEVHMTRLSTRF